jgi:nucleoside-diphosphate-sugar epimerase
MKNAIVSGATGFIGAVLVKHLLDNGVAVIALGRKTLSQLSLETRKLIDGAVYIKLEMADIESLPEVLSNLEMDFSEDSVFFNLAWGGKDRLSDLSVEAQLNNVIWSAHAMEAAKRIGISRFVHAGTMEEPFANAYLNLDHKVNTEYNRHVVYALAKIASKRVLKAKSLEIGVDFFHVLHSHVMGPRDSKDSFLQTTIVKLLNGEDSTFSSGNQIFDVVSVEDCARGFYLVGLAGFPEQSYWIGSGEPMPLRFYVEQIYRILAGETEPVFGNLPYNDVVLGKEVFSIDTLKHDTGYAPLTSFQECVVNLSTTLGNGN